MKALTEILEVDTNFYIQPQKISSIPNARQRFTEAIKNLKAKVKGIGLAHDRLSQQVQDIVETLGDKKIEERICIYFEKRDEFVKAIHYLQNQKIHVEVLGSGAFWAPASTAGVLENENFKFKIASSPREVYNNKELVESWRQQVKQHYEIE